jgi:hypothetical protein
LSRLRLSPRIRQLLVEGGVGIPRSEPLGFVISPRLRQICVNFLSVGQIERNCPVHLLQGEYGKRLRDALGRLPFQKGINGEPRETRVPAIQ